MTVSLSADPLMIGVRTIGPAYTSEQLGGAAVHLRTRRLLLSRPTLDDVDDVLAINSDGQAIAFNPSDRLTARAEAEALVKRWVAQWNRYGGGYWVVRDRSEPVTVGFCGTKNIEFGGKAVLNLFYRFFPKSWGQGYASESSVAAVEWAVSHFPDLPVVARIRPENAASILVAQRAGLVRAESLDSEGEDGLDLTYVRNWTDGTGI